MKACAQEVGEATFIACSQYFGQADNDPTQNCSAQRIYSSQDDGRESKERSAAQRGVNGKGLGGEKDTTDGGDGGGNTPGQRVDSADIDAQRQRGFGKWGLIPIPL